jgi:steroid delta-isomerase-like uncharacterized protein
VPDAECRFANNLSQYLASIIDPLNYLSVLSSNLPLTVARVLHLEWGEMSNTTSGQAAKAVVRRNTEEVQRNGNFEVFEDLFADDFVDHTPQPGTTPDKAGVRKLYTYLRVAFPDFHAEIHWQLADGDRVTTYKTYHGTHEGPFLGVAPTHRKVHFESVDVMRVQNGKITDHWGVGNLLSLMRQIGGWTPPSGI